MTLSFPEEEGSVERFSDIGAAVIGSGFIGTVHIEALRRLGVDVRGVIDATPELAEAAATRLGLPHAYPDLGAALADPDVDIIHVTSPNQFHYPQVKAILAADKHVICEKPLAVTSDESRELVALAAASDRITAVNFNIRFYPLNQHARRMVADGELGDIRLITGHYFQDWLLLDTDWNWRLEPDKGGTLRAVGDIGSHWIDLTNFITGLKVQSVMADLSTFVKVRQKPVGEVETFSQERAADTEPVDMTTDDAAVILLRYANGARGSVAISQISAGRKNSVQWEIDGADAAAAWDSETPDHLWIGHRGRPNEILQRGAELMNETGIAATALPGGHVEGFADSMCSHFREVYRAVLTGAPPADPLYATFEAGHHEMTVGDAVTRSAAEDRWVDVED
jgi:predicted dehydrogenase